MKTATINTSITAPSKSETEKAPEVLFKISIQVIGVKRKCRKSERHFFQLGYIPYNDGNYNSEEIADKVRGFIETNMREVNSIVRVSLDHVTVSTSSLGWTSTQWEPFSKLNKSFDMSF